MRPTLLSILLVLLFAGNVFGACKLFTAKEEFLTGFPRLTENGYFFFRFLPVVNIIALTGIWFWQSWAAYLAIACGVVVIACDIYFGISYHLYVAVPSTLLLLFFIIKYWSYFR